MERATARDCILRSVVATPAGSMPSHKPPERASPTREMMQREPVRPKERFLVFGAPPIEEAEVREVVASLHSGWLGTGPKVAQFEADFARYRRAPQAVAVNSCT